MAILSRARSGPAVRPGPARIEIPAPRAPLAATRGGRRRHTPGPSAPLPALLAGLRNARVALLGAVLSLLVVVGMLGGALLCADGGCRSAPPAATPAR